MNSKIISLIVWTLILRKCPTHSSTCTEEWVQRSFECSITDNNTLVLYFDFEASELQPQTSLYSYYLVITLEETGTKVESRVQNCSRKRSEIKKNTDVIECVAFAYRQKTHQESFQKRYRIQLVQIKKNNSSNNNNNNSNNNNSSNNNNTEILRTELSYVPPWITHHCCKNYNKFVRLQAKTRYDEITLSWDRRWFLMPLVTLRYWNTNGAINITTDKHATCDTRDCDVKIFALRPCHHYDVCIGSTTIEGVYEQCLKAQTKCFKRSEIRNDFDGGEVSNVNEGYLTVELTVSLIIMGGLMVVACLVVVIVRRCSVVKKDVDNADDGGTILPRSKLVLDSRKVSFPITSFVLLVYRNYIDCLTTFMKCLAKCFYDSSHINTPLRLLERLGVYKNFKVGGGGGGALYYFIK